MYTGTYCQLMAEYSQWMNQKLYAICAGIPDEVRKQDRGAFFKSIHGTLNHLLMGDRIYLERFTQQSPSRFTIGDELYAEFADLRTAQAETDQQILTWARQVNPDWLQQPYDYVSRIDGQRRILPTWVLVTQMFNHQTHHRGQLTTLLTQLGHDPGITDIPWLPVLNQD